MKTLAFALSVLPLLCIAGSRWTQADLENRLLAEGGCPNDDMNNLPDCESRPEWEKDALKEYEAFVSNGGWTTNELVAGLILATTNHLYSPSWPAERDRLIAATAFSALSRINQDCARSFISQICTNGVKGILAEGVSGIYRYSQFEPEVFNYMRRVCLNTNQYERWVGCIAFSMLKCFEDRPNYYNEIATNGFARYNYYVIMHATKDVGIVDRLLARWTVSYSNSIQRLQAMRYVSQTATNAAMAVWATNQVNRLSALPTNQLNNVSWLEE